jgi:hypothetical protein
MDQGFISLHGSINMLANMWKKQQAANDEAD